MANTPNLGLPQNANWTTEDVKDWAKSINDENSNNNAFKKIDDFAGESRTNIGNKQDTLISGTNIKTINNQSILGSGNIPIKSINEQSLVGEGNINIKNINDQSLIGEGRINVKTINNQSVLGEGNIEIISSTQADFDQNDDEANDYIKNRPFYDTSDEYISIDEVIEQDLAEPIITESAGESGTVRMYALLSDTYKSSDNDFICEVNIREQEFLVITRQDCMFMDAEFGIKGWIYQSPEIAITGLYISTADQFELIDDTYYSEYETHLPVNTKILVTLMAFETTEELEGDLVFTCMENEKELIATKNLSTDYETYLSEENLYIYNFGEEARNLSDPDEKIVMVLNAQVEGKEFSVTLNNFDSLYNDPSDTIKTKDYGVWINEITESGLVSVYTKLGYTYLINELEVEITGSPSVILYWFEETPPIGTISYYKFKGKCKTLDYKYIPDGVASWGNIKGDIHQQEDLADNYQRKFYYHESLGSINNVPFQYNNNNNILPALQIVNTLPTANKENYDKGWLYLHEKKIKYIVQDDEDTYSFVSLNQE